MSNYQILSLIIPYYKLNKLNEACEALLKEAYRSWTVDDHSVVDDITFILVFLNAQGSEGSEPREKYSCFRESSDREESMFQQSVNLPNSHMKV
jgi:hypothetical protein